MGARCTEMCAESWYNCGASYGVSGLFVFSLHKARVLLVHGGVFDRRSQYMVSNCTESGEYRIPWYTVYTTLLSLSLFNAP